MDKHIELGHLPQNVSKSQTADNANVNNYPATQEKKTDEIELIPEEHKCHKCDVQFSAFNLLYKHFLDVHVEFVNGQFCAVCGQILKDKMDLVAHRVKCRSEVHEEAETDANREDLSVAREDINSLSGSPTDVLRKKYKTRRQKEVTFVDGGVEISSSPLSTAIFIRAALHPTELMIVWTDNLEEDVFLSITLNPHNTILCVKELKMTESQSKKIKRENWFNFVNSAENGFGTSWTVIHFGGNAPVGIKNRLFNNSTEMEQAFAHHAESRKMPMVNMMKYQREGLYPALVQALVGKKFAFNYQGFA